MHKFESDMTPKEKRQAEIKKLKKMTLSEKASHMWAYHKLILFMPLIVIVLVISIFRWVENSRFQSVLSIAVTDSIEMDTRVVAEEIKSLLNIENRYSTISLDNAFFTIDGELNMESVQKFAVVVSARGLDIFITREQLFKTQIDQGIFMDLNEIFSIEELAQMDLLGHYGISVGDSAFILNDMKVPYSPVYLGVIANVDLNEVDHDGVAKIDMIRDFYFHVIH